MTEQDEKQTHPTCQQHWRVTVFPPEKESIEHPVREAGLSVARYLCEVGPRYEIK